MVGGKIKSLVDLADTDPDQGSAFGSYIDFSVFILKKE